MTKVYQQELEELQRLKTELIKKHPELAGFEERGSRIPERKHESLKVIRATVFSKFVRLP